MKLFVLVAFLATSYADISLLRERERNRPPQNSYSSGGGDFLSAPRNTYIPPNNQYIPPSNQYIPPSNTYLPPNQHKPSTTSKPVTQYLPPSKPSQTYLPAQNSYLPPSNKGPTTPPVPILKYVNELKEDGSYKYETLTGDQTHIEQMGHIENAGTDHEEQVMHGSYSYIGDDGKTYKVTYIADSNGFRAFGDHLPTPPPIPREIQESIDKNAAEEANQGYPSRPAQQGYPSGPAQQGYPSGQAQQGYPSGRPQQPTKWY